MMDKDCAKRLGEATMYPVSTARRNVLGMGHSSWARIKKEIRYNPYKPIRCHKLKPADLPRQLQFCNWLVTRSDD